ncbi:MAG: GDSL-type esterase/lipase family protein [Planctomycetia bacterium]|nr:GDSL-type esterase/lipase family protein [Planctomycetia bacterium]
MKKTLKRSCWLLAVLVLLTSQAILSAQEQPLPPTVVPANKMDVQWWKERHEANKARIAQGNVDLLLVGDSITHGWDGVGTKVQEYYYGDRNFVNMGFGGDQTQHVLWRLNDAPMDKIEPKAAMLLIGINNLWGDWENCSENVALGIKACVDKLQSLYPDIKILVLDIFPTHETADSAVRPRAAATNALLPELLKDYKNVTIMDINHLWLDENGKMPKELMNDFVHPTEYGYKLWGAEVEPVIAKMLGDEPKAKME